MGNPPAVHRLASDLTEHSNCQICWIVYKHSVHEVPCVIWSRLDMWLAIAAIGPVSFDGVFIFLNTFHDWNVEMNDRKFWSDGKIWKHTKSPCTRLECMSGVMEYKCSKCKQSTSLNSVFFSELYKIVAWMMSERAVKHHTYSQIKYLFVFFVCVFICTQPA